MKKKLAINRQWQFCHKNEKPLTPCVQQHRQVCPMVEQRNKNDESKSIRLFIRQCRKSMRFSIRQCLKEVVRGVRLLLTGWWNKIEIGTRRIKKLSEINSPKSVRLSYHLEEEQNGPRKNKLKLKYTPKLGVIRIHCQDKLTHCGSKGQHRSISNENKRSIHLL